MTPQTAPFNSMQVLKTSSTNCERVHGRKGAVFKRASFLFSLRLQSHTRAHGEKALHGGLVCDEMGCCLLERGEVDLGSYRSESQLYGGIDGEALETPQPLSPVSSFGRPRDATR